MPSSCPSFAPLLVGKRAVFTLGILFGICISFLLLKSDGRIQTFPESTQPRGPLIDLIPTLALTTTSGSALTAAPTLTSTQAGVIPSDTSTPPVKTKTACEEETDFLFEELVKTPEVLFTLDRLTTGEWDPVKQAMRIRGVISLIPSLRCRCQNRLGGPEILAACGPHSYFEVSAEGPALLATLPRFDNLTGEWIFDLYLPLAGKYAVTVNLYFYSFPDLLKDFSSKDEALQYHASHAPGQRYILRTVNKGNINLGVAIPPEMAAGAEAKRATLCSLEDYRGNLPGYWNNTLWQPYTCTPQRLPNRKKVFATKWVAILGDSNTRTLFYHLTYKLGLSKEGIGNTRFVCIGEDWVITLATFWPWNLDLQAYFDGGLARIMSELDPNITLPEGFVGRQTPDFLFMSYGSHTQERIGRNYILEILQTVTRRFPDLNGVRPKFVVLMTTATAPEKIPGVKELEGYHLIQNNPRVNLVNQEGLELYDRSTLVLDFFSTTLPLTATNRSRDAVHFQNPAYSPHATYFFHLLELSGL